MARSEREHNATFDRMIAVRKVRPTALSPLWSLADSGSASPLH
jgi:demethoxyubiquinone hydroxylase (CLK1/Coq7/Cat5 family)